MSFIGTWVFGDIGGSSLEVQDPDEDFGSLKFSVGATFTF